LIFNLGFRTHFAGANDDGKPAKTPRVASNRSQLGLVRDGYKIV